MHGDSLQRIGIKLFAANGAIGDIHAFVPIFHSWIQRRILPGHVLIDVHDYGHIHNGPGILLVAHEANISIDSAAGRPGLLYHRKQPLDGPLHERIHAILNHALQACWLLEQEPALAGKLRFPKNEILLITNDRLNSPNETRTFEELQRSITAACQPILGKVVLGRADSSPKERLAVSIRPERAPL